MRQITKILLCFMSLFLVFNSCENKMDEHYEVPDWLKGSAWDVLAERGNYSVFLKGAELSGFKPLLEGRSILTVMAPDDNAFSVYLKENGYTDISEMNKEELSKLIGFHLLYYSYNKERLVNFCPEGDLASSEDKEKSAGRYYKFRTWSSSSPTTEIDPLTEKAVTIYHLDRFIPVFSHLFFAKKEIDPKANYEYFYPGSIWSGDGGFNVSNASVNEYALLADNGYVYTIDKVLEPLETIYNEMKNRKEYSTFLDLYDDYTVYNYDKTLSTDYGASIGVDSLYLHGHGTDLPPIAMEWPVSSFQNVKSLASIGYGLFAPSNNAINKFYTDFWRTGGYESLKNVDALVMGHFIRQFVYVSSIAFPEEISRGSIVNLYGVPFNFDPYTVKDRAICVNGSFYGLDELRNPPLFESVVGPAFQYKKYVSYLYALDGSSLLNSYVSSDTEYIMLMPENDQMVASGYELRTNDTGTSLQVESENGWVDVSSSTKQDIVNMHTINGVAELKTSGTSVYPAQITFSYLFVKDGKITSNALFNQYLEPDFAGKDAFVPFKEITYNGSSWSNGKTYSYDNLTLFEPENTDGLVHALAVCNDGRYQYNSFVQLLKKAEMVSGTSIPFLTGARIIGFIPTNEAIATAMEYDEIPGIKNGSIDSEGKITVAAENFDIKVLKEYLQSYFLRSTENIISTYPYPGSAMKSATYTTASGRKLQYTDNGNTLSVKLEDGQVANVIPKYDYFPFAYQDGCFHFINKIL